MPYIQIDSIDTTRSAPTLLSRLAATLLVSAGFVAVAAFVVCVGIFGLAMWAAGVILRLVSIPFKALDRLLGGDKGRAAQPGPEGRPWNPGAQGLFGWTANRARPIFRTFVVRNGYAGAARGQQADRPGQGAADDPIHAGPAPADEGPTIDLEQDESGRWK